MYNSVDFRIFPNVVQITPLSDSRTFPSPLRETSCPLAVHPTSPLLHIPATTSLFLVSVDLPILNTQAGIKIAGRNINNLRYADDTTLLAESEEELKSLLMKVKEESENVGFKFNIQKTKIMASGPITS